MAFTIGWLGTLLIIGAVILIAIYMYCCFDNGIKMFADPRYEERIEELEKKIKLLEEKE